MLPIEELQDSSAPSEAAHARRGSRIRLLWIALLATLAFVEGQTSLMQAGIGAATAAYARFELAPGRAIRPPLRARSGPYDTRLGYDRIDHFIDRLGKRGYEVVAQARISPTVRALTHLGITPPYREKPRPGLRIVDAVGDRVFAAPTPELAFDRFEEIPAAIVDSLLFIENRDLFEPVPSHNPAVEWPRLARATLAWSTYWLLGESRAPGGSTLATQLQKLRHTPGARTENSVEKLRQMASATLRAYRSGPETLDERRTIVVDYLNSIMLAAVPGHGEVIGLPMALALWYGSDYRVVAALIDSTPEDLLSLRAKAYAYRQALSLILAANRPGTYLLGDPHALAARTDRFLWALGDAGVIDAELRDAALMARPEFHLRRYKPATPTLSERDVARPNRTFLLGLLGVDSLYELDRLDVDVTTTTSMILEREVQDLLDSIRDPDSATFARLRRQGLLNDADPSALTLSLSLYERTRDSNRLRLHADTRRSHKLVDDSVMLDLGSTAKLRTLATYLDLVARLYDRDPQAPESIDSRDRLAQWARDRRNRHSAETRRQFLQAALERKYSASPNEKFYTGRGFHRFANFNKDHDGSHYSVRYATRHSINLVFIRLMRDIVDHLIFGVYGERNGILTEIEHPMRITYLENAARAEAMQLLRRHYARYRGKSPEAMRELLFDRVHPTPRRVATITRIMQPALDAASLAAELERFSDETEHWQLDDLEVADMRESYDPSRFEPRELAYLAGAEWLELWTLRFLTDRPAATRAEMLAAAEDQCHAAFGWLYDTRRKRVQDRRIFAELEEDAFRWIHRHWQSQGYPFARLVPSLATSLGASADRPSALAELMGIIQGGGIRLPTVRIESLRFASDTPYEVLATPVIGEPEQVMPADVASVLSSLLMEVVDHGTARRAGGALPGPGGAMMAVAGKTGTGDHVRKTTDAAGNVTSAQAVSRSAVFPFMIGERFFGVITAFVTGPDSDRYTFTSSLATDVFRQLRLVLMSAVEVGDDESPPPVEAADKSAESRGAAL